MEHQTGTEVQAKEQKKGFGKDDPATARLIKGMSGLTLPLMLYPLALEACAKDIKDVDPENYFALKRTARDLIDTLKKSVAEFEEALATFN